MRSPTPEELEQLPPALRVMRRTLENLKATRPPAFVYSHIERLDEALARCEQLLGIDEEPS